MSVSTEIQKSITDQIFDELFTRLQEHEEFDASTIDKLQKLAQQGDLKKAQQVVNVIKVKME